MKLFNGLRRLRDARGLGVTALAKQVGISRQTVYAIEAGRYLPNTKIALTMAQALHVPVEELFSLNLEQIRPSVTRTRTTGQSHSPTYKSPRRSSARHDIGDLRSAG